ncbi:CerR family C-terminal domain-containing protein [Desulfomonile tiedjei]|uniref:Transcriptional regulator n=1 Tax=Desulfomonile tiedjei (strain ATCC 49306 / DSM 6799 / DCB-1) TaxID=706587 RepID=I4C3A4_DESTA|nr:CerR family C-terminal domain-containing protein [Desulfomonile tiedjei]AFM24045.1 transcriptional regulator [Desulfomonile tiedjei DSM 6799]
MRRNHKHTSDAKQRLMDAGLDLFGKFSFDGASTRMLTNRAQVNLSAIQYYFGGKEGLYRQVVRSIAVEVGSLVKPRLNEIEIQLRENPSREQGIQLFCDLIDFMISQFLGSPQTQKWLSIVIREQMEPTEAFDILYDGFLGPMFDCCFRLVSTASGASENDPEVKVRTFALMGQLLTFHISRALIRRNLNWTHYGEEEVNAIRNTILGHVRTVLHRNGDI